MPSEAVSILFRHPSRSLFRGLRRRPLGEFLKTAAAAVAPGCPVTCLITDDRELQDLNRAFRHKDSPTDVLSFPNSNEAASGDSTGAAGGEIAISLDRAAAQAAGFGHAIEDELRILMLHGLLHLAGMDHETDRGQMARTEALWRKRLKLPPGLVERAEALSRTSA
jgi:probable rRNA maturation factor